MKLLFITQKLHGQDHFTLHWIREFEKRGYTVTVLCLEKQLRDQEAGCTVLSMGKERGIPKMAEVWNFWRHIWQARPDRVFIHMSPVWYTLGCWLWLWRGIPVYLWYTHYKMQLGVRLFRIFGKRFFCATTQSLPQFEGNPKKIVTGHGIDLAYWQKKENRAQDPYALLVVHRLSRSKRLEISIRALALLPETYSMTIYGIEAELAYVMEIQQLISALHVSARVTFRGSIPMKQLADIYPRHRLILNMAQETIDKTMLEAMTCGCYPVTTKRNAKAIGIKEAPDDDTPKSVAAFIQNFHGVDSAELYRIVAERHSLERMVRVMDGYMAKGI